MEQADTSESQRSRRKVGIRFPQWWSFGPQLTGGVVDYIREHEMWRLANENSSYGEMEAVNLDGNWQGDGLILFRASEEELQQHREQGRAVVLVSTEGPDLGYPRVVPDNGQAGRMAADHLIEGSHEHFAFLARGETFYCEEQFAPGVRRYARERLLGFCDRLKAFHFQPQVHYLKGRPLWRDNTWRKVQAEVVSFLEELPSPCGLFVADDSLGAVVLRAADEIGLKVPEDCAVIGFGDDMNYCYATFPAMSSIRFPARELGYRAAELLHRQMEGHESRGEELRIPVTNVVPRESSDVLAIPDAEIRKLVRWIRRRAPHDPLRVAEVGERSSLSLTTIKVRFGQHLGHSPKEEIKRIRIAHLVRLVGETDLSLREIADQMGFPSGHELSRFFLAETGERPSCFRERVRERRTGVHLADAPAVIFDLDGTLLDTEPIYLRAYQQALRGQGFDLDDADYFEHLAGTSDDNIEQWLRERSGERFDLAQFHQEWIEAWKESVGQEHLPLRSGVHQVMDYLRQRRIPVGIATSSSREAATICLERAGLNDEIEVVCTSDDVHLGKPDPELYLLTAERLGRSAGNCLVFEDSNVGVRAAVGAGMQVVMAPNRIVPDSYSEERALLIVESLEEVCSEGEILPELAEVLGIGQASVIA